MRDLIKKFRQSFWETRFFVWKILNFDELKLLQNSIHFAETLHTFLTYQCLQKGVRDFFILFRSWVICKNKKRHGLYTLVFYILITTQHLSKAKKSRKPFGRHCWVGNVCKISAKILTFVAVGTRRSFQFFRQITWFPEIIELF